MPWKPSRRGEVPTLGFSVLEWMTEFLAAPDRAEYAPFEPTREQAQFIVNFYALDSRSCKRRYRRGVLSRPKGWGKSPLLAAIACAEALADVVPAGWDDRGQPVGRPWSSLRTPWVQLAATSEDQSRNSWAPLLEMLRGGPAVDEYPGLEPLDSFVNLPRGRIEAVTAAAASREGNRPVFCVLDQTEAWTASNGGVKLAATLRRNLGKTGGSSIESPNAFIPGLGSVAEASAEYCHRIREGDARDDGLLYDHQEAPADTDLTDRESLLRGLAVAYGDSAQPVGGWVNLERLVAEIWDPATDPQDARAYYLGQITHASDAWITSQQWALVADPTRSLADRDTVTLGFDGSVRDDSTALVACRVQDGHLELLGCWERPDGLAGDAWQVDRVEVDAAVAGAFDRFRVVGFYADPAFWVDTLDRWTTEFGSRLLVHASHARPLEWWTNRPKHMVDALERFHEAVVSQQLSHDGNSVLTRHVLNARRRIGRSGVTIAKENPSSNRKIDAAMAATLAYECRGDAVAKGLGQARRSRRAVGF